MLHLPDVRLCARAVRFARKGHALDVYARVRRPSAALYLVHSAARYFSVAADRVRPPEFNLYVAEQAKATAVGAGTTCERLGRSSHADACRQSPARVYA